MMEKKLLGLFKTRNVVVVLILLHFFFSVASMQQKSITSDELPHIVAGYAYLTTGDFRYNPEHPPLVKEISALPLLFIKPNLDTESEAWQKSYEWIAGKNFFFVDNSNADLILFLARLPMVLLSCLLAWFVFLFAKRLYGIKAGLFALFLYSFSPNILAHARIVQTDVPAAFGFLVSVYLLFKLFKNFNWKNVILLGLIIGVSLAIKFTTIYLIILLPILFIIFLINNKIQIKQKILTNFLQKLVVIVLVALFVLFVAYGFKFDLFNHEARLNLIKDVVPGQNSFFENSVAYLIDVIPIPTPYIFGLNQVVRQSKTGNPAYALGEHFRHGVWYFFIVAFFVKTPIATLLLIILSLVFFRKVKGKLMDELFLIIPILFLFLVFVLSNLNIGLRHILVIYPFIFIFVSKLANIDFKNIIKKKVMKIIIIILMIWYVVSSILIYPNYLAYFNEVVMPKYGPNFLIDSNVDWGQDLKGLANYLKENNIDEKIYLMYWGNDDAEYRMINYENYRRVLDENNVCEPVTGYLAVSVNYLKGLSKDEAHCFDWLKGIEPLKRIGYSIYLYELR